MTVWLGKYLARQIFVSFLGSWRVKAANLIFRSGMLLTCPRLQVVVIFAALMSCIDKGESCKALTFFGQA
jgi:hypothetical protein